MSAVISKAFLISAASSVHFHGATKDWRPARAGSYASSTAMRKSKRSATWPKLFRNVEGYVDRQQSVAGQKNLTKVRDSRRAEEPYVRLRCASRSNYVDPFPMRSRKPSAAICTHSTVSFCAKLAAHSIYSAGGFGLVRLVEGSKVRSTKV